MKVNNDYIGLIDEVLQQSSLPIVEKEKLREVVTSKIDEFERKFSIGIKVIFSVAILCLFGMSYYFAFNLIEKILAADIDLIGRNLMKATDRSINATTVSVLLAATVTQTGLALYTVTKYLFSSSATAKTP